jgi:hypothetical protein
MKIRGKVVWRFGAKAKIQLEDGRVLFLNEQQIRSLNCAMDWGDTGELYQLPNGQVKFRIDADDVDLRPVPTPAIIQTPTDENSNA